MSLECANRHLTAMSRGALDVRVVQCAWPSHGHGLDYVDSPIATSPARAQASSCSSEPPETPMPPISRPS